MDDFFKLLIDPIDPQDFFTHYFDKQHIHVK